MTTADEFLAHYGVKGMKWGKRRAKSTSTSTATRREKATRIAKVSAGVAIAAGIAAASLVVASNSGVRLSSLDRQGAAYKRGMEAAMKAAVDDTGWTLNIL